MRERCYDARDRLIDARANCAHRYSSWNGKKKKKKEKWKRRVGVPTAADRFSFLVRAFYRTIDRSVGPISQDTRETWEAESANGGALERSRGFFPLRSAFNKRARRNQRTLYVIEEEEKRGEIERPRVSEGKRTNTEWSMKAEGSAFDDELFTALCSGVQAFTSIPRFLLLRHHLHLLSVPRHSVFSLPLFLFLPRGIALISSFALVVLHLCSSNNTSHVSGDLIPFMRWNFTRPTVPVMCQSSSFTTNNEEITRYSMWYSHASPQPDWDL